MGELVFQPGVAVREGALVLDDVQGRGDGLGGGAAATRSDTGSARL